MKRTKTYRRIKYIVYRQTIINPIDHLWTFLGAFFGICTIGWLQSKHLPNLENMFLIGSFGASAVLVYGATNSPLAQPKNLIGGHLICALVGVSVAKLIPAPEWNWFACSLAVAVSIVCMQITKTMHPPGGATALIANIGSVKIKALGFMYVLSPVLIGVMVLFVVAILFNNIPKNRHYPYKPYRIKYRLKKLLGVG